MKLRLSIKQNLLVVVTLDENLKMKNAGIQSYTTMVGFIENGKIFENGKFSRTTTKHMNEIIYITRLPKEDSGQRKNFWEYPYGTRISHPDSLSSSISSDILKGLSRGESFFEAVFGLDRLSKIGNKDLKIIKGIFGSKDQDFVKSLDIYIKVKRSFALT